MEIIVLVFALIFSTIISGLFFGYGGWTEPVAAGLKVIREAQPGALNIPQWHIL